jgi:hypothetical protein
MFYGETCKDRSAVCDEFWGLWAIPSNILLDKDETPFMTTPQVAAAADSPLSLHLPHVAEGPPPRVGLISTAMGFLGAGWVPFADVEGVRPPVAAIL